MGVALCGALCVHLALPQRADSLPVDPQRPGPAPFAEPKAGGEDQPDTLRQRVELYVRAVTQNPGFSDYDSLVRWNEPICLFVAGLAEDDAKALSARLTQIISAAGAPLARKSCQPNFCIIVTSEPGRVLEAWYRRDKHLFGDATALQIRRFLDASGSMPIQVWRSIDRGRVAGMTRGHFAPSNVDAESSAFVRNAVLGFFSVIAVVDTNLASHITPTQQADYVAMAGLSNIDLDADIGTAPSILHLFTTRSPTPAELSSWDAAFMKALYQSDQTSRNQRGEITERITNAISLSP
jgi:hypothetical protein